MKTDLIIIGSGPGGYHTAGYAARNGLNVTIIEAGEVGGTCLNCGCIPTKCYVHDAGNNTLAYAYARKEKVVQQLRTGVETLLQQPRITLIKGKAQLVASPEGPQALPAVQVGTEIYEATNIIIATGSEPKLLPIAGIDSPYVMTSTQLLNLQEPPQRLCIIGAGVVGMELASAFQKFGSQVTVVEYLKECLPMLDADIAKRLRKTMEKQGITFYMGAAVKNIDGQRVVFEQKGKENNVEADVILCATGRQAVTRGLGLEEIGVSTGPRGIVVDDHFRTSAAGIYAIGDCNGRQMLAHAASAQGVHVVNTILGRPDGIRFDIMPSAIFTDPEAACVTLSPIADASESIVHKSFYRANGKALTMEAAEGMVKIFEDAATGRLTGCHAFGAQAAALVQEVAALMNRDTTYEQLLDIIHIHPTLSEILAG